MVMSTDGTKPVGELAARTWVPAGAWGVVRGDYRDRLGEGSGQEHWEGVNICPWGGVGEQVSPWALEGLEQGEVGEELKSG